MKDFSVNDRVQFTEDYGHDVKKGDKGKVISIDPHKNPDHYLYRLELDEPKERSFVACFPCRIELIPKKPKFKVGDEVRVVDDCGNAAVSIGDKGIIKSMWRLAGEYMVVVDMVVGEVFVYERHLELIPKVTIESLDDLYQKLKADYPTSTHVSTVWQPYDPAHDVDPTDHGTHVDIHVAAYEKMKHENGWLEAIKGTLWIKDEAYITTMAQVGNLSNVFYTMRYAPFTTKNFDTVAKAQEFYAHFEGAE